MEVEVVTKFPVQNGMVDSIKGLWMIQKHEKLDFPRINIASYVFDNLSQRSYASTLLSKARLPIREEIITFQVIIHLLI